MSNIEKISQLASSIRDAVDNIHALEKTRKNWTDPEGMTLRLGNHTLFVVLKDGTVNQSLVGVQQAMLKSIDIEIIKAKGRAEGLAHQLSKLVKSGVAA